MFSRRFRISLRIIFAVSIFIAVYIASQLGSKIYSIVICYTNIVIYSCGLIINIDAKRNLRIIRIVFAGAKYLHRRTHSPTIWRVYTRPYLSWLRARTEEGIVLGTLADAARLGKTEANERLSARDGNRKSIFVARTNLEGFIVCATRV